MLMRKILPLFFIFFVLVFSFCSTDKDPVLNVSKPSVDEPLGSTDTIGQNFNILSKDHILNSDLYIGGGILQNQSANQKYTKETRTWQGIASIGKDRAGYLYSAWISGGKWEGNENYITVSVSQDRGRTWGRDKLVIYVNQEDSTRVMDPSLFNDKFGNLYMAWTKHIEKKSVISKQWSEIWYSKLKFSESKNTIDYSAPRKVAPGIMINKPFSSSITNEMVFPIAVWYAGNSILQQPFMYKGDYGLNSLINFRKVGGMTMNVSKQHMIYEHMFVELKDSTYLGMTRTIDGIYYSKSKDGKVWDMAQKFIDLGPTTSARFHLSKLKSGRLALIFNNSTTRTNMTICLSEDDGQTWPFRMVIDTNPDVSYPDMVETGPGVLNIVYDYARVPSGTINFISIKENDIINNNEAKIFRTKISSLK